MEVDAKYVDFPEVTDVPDALPDVTQIHSWTCVIYLPDTSPLSLADVTYVFPNVTMSQMSQLRPTCQRCESVSVVVALLEYRGTSLCHTIEVCPYLVPSIFVMSIALCP